MPRYSHLKIISGFVGCTFFGAAMANGWSAHVLGGVSFANLGGVSYASVDPLFQNQYTTANQTKSASFAGLGMAYQWDQIARMKNLAFNLGLTGYYVENTLAGVNSPAININGGSGFDSLNYTADVKSIAVMLEPKLIYTAYRVQPYALFGLGVARNEVNNYAETATGTTLPFPSFQPHSDTNFAYELGAGVQYALLQNSDGSGFNLALEYRFMNWGEMSLAPAANQPTTGAPNFGSLRTNMIDAALIWQF